MLHLCKLYSSDDSEGQESPTKKRKVTEVTLGDRKVVPNQSMDKIRDFIRCKTCDLPRYKKISWQMISSTVIFEVYIINLRVSCDFHSQKRGSVATP